MATLKEMAQAHVLNVQNELRRLEERRVSIEQEIVKVKEYIKESMEALESDDSDSANVELAE